MECGIEAYDPAMPRHTPNARPVEDPVVRSLRDDLWYARHTVVALMPEEAKTILESYYHCVTVEDTETWVRGIADDLLALAVLLPEQRSERARCPLCGSGAQTAYAEGFALPEGLRMHLEGKVNSRQCPVVEAARGLAEGSWTRDFGERGAARHAHDLAKQSRRRTETQYLIHPYKAARLLDEGRSMAQQVRDAAGIDWAVERLLGLGFRITRGQRLRAFTKETGNAAVYADPRMKGAIAFVAVLKPLNDELSYMQRRRAPFRQFQISDARKHGVEQVLDREIAEAVRALSPGLRVVG